MLQVVADDVKSFRSKVNDAVAVIDNLDSHKQTWLEQTSRLKARTARFGLLLLCHVQRHGVLLGVLVVVVLSFS